MEQSVPKTNDKVIRDRIFVISKWVNLNRLLKRTGNNKNLFFSSQTLTMIACVINHRVASPHCHLFSLAESLCGGAPTQEKVADLSEA